MRRGTSPDYFKYFGAVGGAGPRKENCSVAAIGAALHRWKLDTLELVLERLAERNSLPAHLATGARGERAAYFYLRRLGFVVVARGWRSHIVRGDLDLVAWEDDALCFVEVKTRTSRQIATAEASVDEEKRKHLRRLARHFVRQLNRPNVRTRFDIVSVYLDAERVSSIEIFRNAFEWS
jgi:putative endonuclease